MPAVSLQATGSNVLPGEDVALQASVSAPWADGGGDPAVHTAQGLNQSSRWEL